MSFINRIDSMETSGCARVDSCALAVIGAGPHALSIVTRLLASEMKDTDGANEADKVRSTFWSRRLGSMTSASAPSSNSSRPKLTQYKGSKGPDKPAKVRPSILNHVRVFDPSGTWMHTWNSLFSALEIPHLRSPSFVTPDPFDSQLACRAYAARHGLDQAKHFKPLDALFPTVVGSAEKSGQGHLSSASAPPASASIKGGLAQPDVSDAADVGRKGRQGGKAKAKGARILRLNEVSRDSFALPSTPLFNGLCSELVSSHGLSSSVTPAAVTRIIPLWNNDLPEGISSWDSPGAFLALQAAIAGPQCRSPRSSPPTRFALLRSDDSVTIAERVVVATGSQGKPRIPAWVQQAVVAQGVCPASGPATVDWPALLRATFRSSLLHTCQLPSSQAHAPTGPSSKADAAADVHTAETGWLRPHLAGKRIVIVGGGLTSAHLMLVALASGCASVTLIVRRDTLLVKQFDLGLSWMTRARPALQFQYWSLSPEERVSHMRAARGGGSVSPEVYERLMQAVKDSRGRARIMTGMEVCQAEYADAPMPPSPAWTLSVQPTPTCGDTGPACTVSPLQVAADLVILATGCAVDVRNESLFADLLASCPPASDPLAGGLPLLDADLRWSPEVPVYLCGVWAAHQLGPDALNLMGGQNAARRLWPVLRPWLDGVVEGKGREGVCDGDEAENEDADTSIGGEEDGASTMDAASSTACEGECCTHETPLTSLTPKTAQSPGGSSSQGKLTTAGHKEEDSRVQSTLSRFLGGDGNMFSILGMGMDSDCED